MTTTFDIQQFQTNQIVTATQMNAFYQDKDQKLTAYFPITPSICSGANFTVAANALTITAGVIRFVDQPNVNSGGNNQATFANLAAGTTTITVPSGASPQYYIVVILTQTSVDGYNVTNAAAVSPTALTLAQIAAETNPSLYVPIAAITNLSSVYTIFLDSNCAHNAQFPDITDNALTGAVTIGGRIIGSTQALVTNNTAISGNIPTSFVATTNNGTFTTAEVISYYLPNMSSGMRCTYSIDGASNVKPTANLGATLGPNSGANFTVGLTSVGTNYLGQYSSHSNVYSPNVIGVQEFYPNSAGTMTGGMYVSNDSNVGATTTGMRLTAGIRPALAGTPSLLTSGDTSFALIQEVNAAITTAENFATAAIAANGVGIIASGTSGGFNWVKYAPDINGRSMLEQWGNVVMVTPMVNITLPVAYTNPASIQSIASLLTNADLVGSFPSGASTNVIVIQNQIPNNSVHLYVIGY